MIPYSGSCNIYTSENIQNDSKELIRQGYLMVGYSGFSGSAVVTKDMLSEQGQNVEADIILYHSDYLGSQQSIIPMPQYTPGNTSTTFSNGSVNASAYGSNGYASGNANYFEQSTTHNSGTWSTEYLPITRQNYSNTAVFWRKGKPPILGAIVEDLPDEIRQSLQRNSGVLVSLVINDSPAFKANIITGDILVGIDGETINSKEDFEQKLIQVQGKECKVTLIRNLEAKEIDVQTNPSM